ncbi:PREDICTED: aquaporin-12-like [Nanorana parkeri]|uniref:aquaporin-12-like n=1 Tax=Nanorana parkeri TaxID=125878 RepID=UPI000854ACD6|nr:PREDICTED: aquaporin-12-like [Nanorana parkeri]
MAGLNIVVGFFISVVALSQLIRWITKKYLPVRIYRCTISELASSLQLCACYMELRMLLEIGMWGGGYGPDVVSTLLFLLFLAHGFTFDGASANPTVSVQEFLLREGPFIDTIVKLLSQYVGMEAARFLTKQYWMLELTDFHTIQVMMADDCSPSLQISAAQGVFVEALCAFCYHLVLFRFQNSRPVYRIPTVALTVTLLAYAGASYTAAYFNPILAYALTFDCSGKSLQENSIVYIGGSLVGMVVALFLNKGNIPRLFQRNLLYSQKSKFRTPKVKNVQPKSKKLSHHKGSEKKSGEARQQKVENVTPKDKSS